MQICIPLFLFHVKHLHCNRTSVNLYLCYTCQGSVVVFVIADVIQRKIDLSCSEIQLCRNVIKIRSGFYNHSCWIACVTVSITNKGSRIDSSDIVFCPITNKFAAVWKTNIITPDNITAVFFVICNEHPTTS